MSVYVFKFSLPMLFAAGAGLLLAEAGAINTPANIEDWSKFGVAGVLLMVLTYVVYRGMNAVVSGVSHFQNSYDAMARTLEAQRDAHLVHLQYMQDKFSETLAAQRREFLEALTNARKDHSDSMERILKDSLREVRR